MEKVIHAIIDADKQAQVRLAKVEAKRVHVRKDAESQKKEIQERYHQDAVAKIAAHKQDLKRVEEAAAANKETEYKATLKQLHDTFQANKDNWIEVIVKRCQES